MNETTITKGEILAVFPNVAQTIADALGCELEKVKLESSLIDDLRAESIDFVDIVYRLQRHEYPARKNRRGRSRQRIREGIRKGGRRFRRGR
jgi:hypothetical protein